MPNDINELDEQDVGLKTLMGKRFKDITERYAEPETEGSVEESTDTTYERKPNPGSTSDVREAIWSPFNAEPSFTQKLTNCAKWSSLFSGLCMLFYYWQCTGQMQPSASVPAMCVCTAMVGWSFGKYAFRGNR